MTLRLQEKLNKTQVNEKTEKKQQQKEYVYLVNMDKNTKIIL